MTVSETLTLIASILADTTLDQDDQLKRIYKSVEAYYKDPARFAEPRGPYQVYQNGVIGTIV